MSLLLLFDDDSGSGSGVLPLDLSMFGTDLQPMPAGQPIVNKHTKEGQADTEWLRWLERTGRIVRHLQPMPITLDTQPNPVNIDAGDFYYVEEFNHMVFWNGSAWQLQPGDPGPGYVQIFQVPPTADGWAVCDGSDTTILVVGATLTEQTVTTSVITDGYMRR